MDLKHMLEPARQFKPPQLLPHIHLPNNPTDNIATNLAVKPLLPTLILFYLPDWPAVKLITIAFKGLFAFRNKIAPIIALAVRRLYPKNLWNIKHLLLHALLVVTLHLANLAQ
jgi:hypothetical protein